MSAHAPRSRLFLLLACALGMAIVLGLSLGSSSVPLSHVAGSLLSLLGLDPGASVTAFESSTVLQLRLPRVVLSVLVGASLALAGAAMQGLFRNALADPGLIGVSSGSAFAAALALLLGRTLPLWAQGAIVPLAAFFGGLFSAGTAMRVARTDGHTRVTALLLTGLATNALFAAGIGFIVTIADPSSLRSINFWMFGSLAKAGWGEMALIAPVLIALMLWLPRQAQALNALLLGESEARHLGIDVERLKRRLLGAVVLSVACCVALTGLIGFVGLLAPHWVRLWVGPDHRTLMPASALCGAALLSFADLISRVGFAPQELPVGIVTALLGAPFFIALLLRTRNRIESW